MSVPIVVAIRVEKRAIRSEVPTAFTSVGSRKRVNQLSNVNDAQE
jgi:hypothetical protein